MKKSIGIITLYHNSCNYGGVLQAYALTRLVQLEGHDASQILYQKQKSKKAKLQAALRKSPGRLVMRTGQQIQTKICDRLFRLDAEQTRRIQAFDRFKRRWIPQSDRVYEPGTISEALQAYDMFICGSDQIWNPNIVDSTYWLEFVPERSRKFAYAASIAAPIPPGQRGQYRRALEQMKGVSVREHDAVDQLKEITGVPVHWVLDPVLALDPAEWTGVAGPQPHSDGYVFCYFLGHERSYRRLASDYARARGWRLVVLPYVSPVHPISDHWFGDEQLFDVAPDRFLSLIRHAACVITDSFHAVALCHIFHTQFWALRRTNQHILDSRVTSLLEHSGLLERMIGSCGRDTLERLLNAKPASFETSDHFLREMREYSRAYLRSCLND